MGNSYTVPLISPAKVAGKIEPVGKVVTVDAVTLSQLIASGAVSKDHHLEDVELPSQLALEEAMDRIALLEGIQQELSEEYDLIVLERDTLAADLKSVTAKHDELVSELAKSGLEIADLKSAAPPAAKPAAKTSTAKPKPKAAAKQA